MFSSVAIITTDSNELVAQLHDRMPIILEGDEEQRWLEENGSDELLLMLDPFPEGQTRSYEVSAKANNPMNEGPELIVPVGSEQSGLEVFE